MRLFITIILFFSTLFANSQTFIEMMSPEDADIILTEVSDPKDADILVYKTSRNKEAKDWDLKWKFKKLGFSNFSIFISKSPMDLHLSASETWDEKEKTFVSQGKVYFVDDKDDREYVNRSFKIDGMMQIKKRVGKLKIKKKDLVD